MKPTVCLLTFYLLGSAAVYAQVEPAATGPGMAPLASNLQYAVRYSQSADFSTVLANTQTSTASGSLTYSNRNQQRPFSMSYAGGYTWTLSGPAYNTGVFQRLLISQGFDSRKWKFLLNDNVSYLPQSPTTGFSGVPGTGETIGSTNPAPSSSQTILTVNTHVVDNAVNGQLEHAINYATSVTASGGFEVMRFPDSNGLDTNSVIGDGTISRRLSGRTSVLGRYEFSQYTYPGITVSMNTQTVFAGLERRWTRNLTSNISGGPSWIRSNSNTVVPAATTFAAAGAVNYQLRLSSLGMSYSHGANGGSGYLIGGLVDMYQGNYLRQFGLKFNLGLTGGYERTAALNNNGVTNAEFGGAQGTWRLGRNLIVFANYTGSNQDSTSQLPGNTLNETLHVISFGFGYASREPHLRP